MSDEKKSYTIVFWTSPGLIGIFMNVFCNQELSPNQEKFFKAWEALNRHETDTTDSGYFACRDLFPYLNKKERAQLELDCADSIDDPSEYVANSPRIVRFRFG